MSSPATFDVIDMHTAGEPVRIVTGGYPELVGRTILDKRREALERHDPIRRALMLEPRGHGEMYGVIPVKPSSPDAAFGALFMHGAGYSTMCGHAVIALGRWLVETGQVPAVEPETRFAIEVPCGVVQLICRVENGKVLQTAFDSVPAYLALPDLEIAVPGLGQVRCDIAYGGAVYAILPASSVGLDFFQTPISKLLEAAVAITGAIRKTVPIKHPSEPDLGFLYGTILIDDAPPPQPTWNLCVFADGQIDRSPTGSGVTARMARDHARGLIRPGVQRAFYGPSGVPFTAQILTGAWTAPPAEAGVVVRVVGSSAFTGKTRFTIEAGDPLGQGFSLPETFGALAGPAVVSLAK
jgi:proline racemase